MQYKKNCIELGIITMNDSCINILYFNHFPLIVNVFPLPFPLLRLDQSMNFRVTAIYDEISFYNRIKANYIK